MMPSRAADADATRTLLVDANIERGRLLTEQLNHAGFRSDFAMTWGAAGAVLGLGHYKSCVVIADLDRAEDLEHLRVLRIAAPRVWVLAVTEADARQVRDPGIDSNVDALLCTPFSVRDLTVTLSEFSGRPRRVDR